MADNVPPDDQSRMASSYGSILVTTASNQTGPFTAIEIAESGTEINKLTDTNDADVLADHNLSGNTADQGVLTPTTNEGGEFTTVGLASGKVWAHYSPNA